MAMRQAVRRRAGITLVEVMIAMGLVAIALLALVSTILAAARLQESTREKTLAYNAMRDLVERMRNEPFAELYARYNGDPADDPAGPGTAAGHTFTIEGVAGSSYYPVGRIFFPENAGTPGLREDYDDPAMGMPGGLDLNGDNVIDSSDHAFDYRILPLRIEVQWTGVSGETRAELNTYISER